MIPTLLKATQLWAHKNSNSSPNLLVTLFLRQFLFTVIYSSWVLITTKQIHQSWIRNYICGGRVWGITQQAASENSVQRAVPGKYCGRHHGDSATVCTLQSCQKKHKRSTVPPNWRYATHDRITDASKQIIDRCAVNYQPQSKMQ